MAPVSRTSSPHNVINCQECRRVRLVQIKGQRREDGHVDKNDTNSNDEIDIHHACKFNKKLVRTITKMAFTSLRVQPRVFFFFILFLRINCFGFFLCALLLFSIGNRMYSIVD